MLHRLAIVFATMLSTALPASAQEPAAPASTGAGPDSGASPAPPTWAREPAWPAAAEMAVPTPSPAPPAPAQEPAAGIEFDGSTGCALLQRNSSAQEPAAGLEFGGGWYKWNPLGVDDYSVFPSGASVDLAWATWCSERRGLAAGVTAVLSRVDPREGNDVVERAFPVYAYVTHRWRWRAGDRQAVHFGLGAGALAGSETTRVRRWNPEIPAWGYSDETESAVGWSLWFHLEVFLTRPVRDGFAVRLGVRFTPLLYLPIAAQPVMMGVWRF